MHRFLEDARIRQHERKIEEEREAAVRERRPAANWALIPLDPSHAFTQGVHDHQREQIVERLLNARGVAPTAKDGFEFIRSMRGRGDVTPTADLVMAAVETSASKNLGRATPHGTA